MSDRGAHAYLAARQEHLRREVIKNLHLQRLVSPQ